MNKLFDVEYMCNSVLILAYIPYLNHPFGFWHLTELHAQHIGVWLIYALYIIVSKEINSSILYTRRPRQSLAF